MEIAFFEVKDEISEQDGSQGLGGNITTNLVNNLFSLDIDASIHQFEQDWEEMFVKQLKEYYSKLTSISNKSNSKEMIENIFTYIKNQVICNYRFKKLGAHHAYIHLYKRFNPAGWKHYDALSVHAMEEGIRKEGIDFIKNKIIQTLREHWYLEKGE